MGERTSLGGVNLRVREVKVPRGTRRPLFPFLISLGMMRLLPFFGSGGRKELSRGYLGVYRSLAGVCGLAISTFLRIARN